MSTNIAIIMPQGLQYDHCIRKILDHNSTVVKIFRLQRQLAKPNMFKLFIKRFLFFIPKYKLIFKIEYSKKKAFDFICNSLKACDVKFEQTYLKEFDQNRIAKELVDNKIDLLLIWGTPIIKTPILDALNYEVINVHTSILPNYKGSFPEFWQFYFQDFESSGVTFHKVDKGIDTGEIIEYMRSSFSSSESSPYFLRAINSLLIVNNYHKVVHRYITTGKSYPQKTFSDQPAFKLKDITMEHQMKVFL